MAAFAKKLLPDTPMQAVVFSRGVMMTAIFVAASRWQGVPLFGKRPVMLLLRGLLGYAALSCYFYSVQHLPLGDAVLLQYSHPVFVAAIARRWPLGVVKWGLILGRSLFLAVYAKTLASAKALEAAIVLILAAFAFLATGTVLPWYILWWLPFLMFKNDWRPVVLWSSVGLGSYLFIYSTSLSLAMIGGAYLVFLMTKELGAEGGPTRWPTISAR
jgi:hypothetical protein